MNQTLKLSFLTVLALIAFAGNSVLCRLALANSDIDPLSFTSIRLLSGVLVLMPIVLLNKKTSLGRDKGSWLASMMLFTYAVCFSFAYNSIDTATGALVLFGSVQLAMILIGLLRGEHLRLSAWLGLSVALFGFAYLVAPKLSTPSMTGFSLMALSGVAWAVYTLLGQRATHALQATAYNFLRTLPLVLIFILAAVLLNRFNGNIKLSVNGVGLAVLSGSLTSGIGYAVWYAVLPKLETVRAAVIQLFVPIIAAIGGVLFAAELISSRLVVSSVLVLGGVLIVIIQNSRQEL